MHKEVTIIGAGPAGLLAATEIASKGYDVSVLEEHDVIGEPDHCAGLLSTTGLRNLGLSPPRDIIQNRIEGARIYSPNGSSISIERGKQEARVVDRRKFDCWLAERATSQGATIVKDFHVSKIHYDEAGEFSIIPRKSDTEMHSRIAIIAEGSKCQLSSQLGYPTLPRKQRLPAYQFEVEGADVDEDFVEMFYGTQISRGFFAWIIPLGEGKARVGVASRDYPKQRLRRGIQKHPIMKNRLSNITITRSMGGTVLVGKPIRNTSKRHSIVIGDTAGIVKATTGGGVIIGGLAAQIAGKTVVDYLKGRIPDLYAFDSRWKSRYLQELRTMYYAQRLITSLSDQGLNRLIESANELNLIDTIRQQGDMDMQKRVIFDLLKDPRMILVGLRTIAHLNPFI